MCWRGVDAKIILCISDGRNNLLRLGDVALRTPVERVADLVRFNVNPNAANGHVIFLDDTEEFCYLLVVGFALVAGAGAGKEVSVKVLVACSLQPAHSCSWGERSGRRDRPARKPPGNRGKWQPWPRALL